ncbi:hypothetical protein [Streptomyces sp. IMTB 2501]|nr:hypothetical protein [Streptomyces sp. IMTB 2501]
MARPFIHRELHLAAAAGGTGSLPVVHGFFFGGLLLFGGSSRTVSGPDGH